MSFNDFEHKLIKFLKTSAPNLSGKKVHISCSGGKDSVALLLAFNKIQPIFKYELSLLHIHHGGEVEYRDKASAFCKKLSEDLKLPFLLYRSSKKLLSEEEARDYRLSVYSKVSDDFVALAHHMDDFTETLILRLIRGTGMQGFKEPFSNKAKLLRPFIRLFRSVDIGDYLKSVEAVYIDDPSNFETDYLRNWVRNTWLPLLEEKQGLSGLSRSLGQIAEAAQEVNAFHEEVVTFNAEKVSFQIPLSDWERLSQYQKKSTIAYCLHNLIHKGYTKGHIDEALKRIEARGSKLSFSLVGVEFKGTKKLISFCKTKDS